jgi:hypothetical protein
MPKDTIIPKDTTQELTQEQIQKVEDKMNEVFEYGQKVIFKSNSKEFLNENVKE